MIDVCVGMLLPADNFRKHHVKVIPNIHIVVDNIPSLFAITFILCRYIYYNSKSFTHYVNDIKRNQSHFK